MKKDDVPTGLEKNRMSHEKITPTAWDVAYDRAQAGIKYAQEIFDEVKPTDALEKKYLKYATEARINIRFEARYKLTNLLLAQNKSSQIFEIASGLSPRGQIMAEEDPSLSYVELDLPDMARNKRNILKNLFTKGVTKPQENLQIEDGDALDVQSLISATKHFKNAPVSIVTEGLLRYLDFNQQALVVKNVHSLLEKFGGVWICPDITLARVTKNNLKKTENQKLVEEISGIDVQKNEFADEESAIKFFEDAGFTVERHTFLEVIDELVCPLKMGLSRKETEESLNRPVFVMRLKK